MPRPRILIVEDDAEWQEIYHRCLRGTDYQVTPVRKIKTALTLLQDQPFDVVITDLKMLGGAEEFSGFGVLEQAKAINPDVQVIVVTGYGSASHALRAIGSGAYDYITKDRDLRKKLALTVQGALEARSLKQELLDAEPQDDVEPEADRIIGNSASMQKLFEQITQAAESYVNVLIRGEGGTGKRLVAQTIHRRSRRKGGPFLVVDCGRLSESVVEAELFGHEAGTLHSASEARPGKFERAKDGTVFLDGIGDMDVRLQPRLLGAICDRTITRVGGQEPVPMSARIIASTDKDLDAMISAGQFPRQLFDALNEFAIPTPPLRKRKDGDDVPALAAMFLLRYGEGRRVSFSDEAVELLHRYDYPGNVRELASVVKHALAVAGGDVILPEHLRPEIRTHKPSRSGKPKPEEPKDPAAILRICPLNLAACSKRQEIVRLYSPRRVFVNVPYREYDEYEAVIRRTLENYGLTPVLSKDYLEPGSLLCNICKLIQTCKYGVTDVSAAQVGSNVLYELGMMHAIGVHCAILRDSRASRASDIQGLLFLEYTNAASMAERLSSWLQGQVSEARRPASVVETPKQVERTKLRRILDTHFNVGELRDLCFDLDIKYDNLSGDGKKEKARELIEYCERHGRITELVKTCYNLRPKAEW
ncbi:MAG: response regulator [Chloroflexi bacterium]|nr:response regulator [Chloroflexota bacterium]